MIFIVYASGISIKRIPFVSEKIVRFIEIPYKNEYLANWCFKSDIFVAAIL